MRLHPVFLYRDSEDTIYGAALGLTGRLYEKADEYAGWYGELGGSLMGHSPKFEGNTSDFNFILDVGVGYQFPDDWHVALKFNHISNSGMGSRNCGVNAVGLGIGFTFRR